MVEDNFPGEEEKKPNIRIRHIISFVFIGIFLLVILGKYFSIMVLSPRSGAKPQVSTLVERGPILDRSGHILAIENRLFSITAWVPSITRPEETAVLLGQVLEVESSDILKSFQNSNGFLYIKRKVSSTISKRISEMKSAGYLNGISLEPEFGRLYPEKEMAAQLIGYTGLDDVGLSGLEFTLDDILAPEPQPVPEGSNDQLSYGNQVFLTIDLNIQYKFEQFAEDARIREEADSVMLFAMDAKTGEILASAVKPGFDPNSYSQYPADTWKNKLVSSYYEPGSVFKIFSVASLLQIGGISDHDIFNCNGFYEHTLPNGQVVTINCLGVHGNVTSSDILKYSCNAGVGYASDSASAQSFYDMLKMFGFGNQVQSVIPGENPGLLRDPGQWSARSKPTIAMGQELGVTPIQILSAATAIANKGVLLKPLIVKKILDPRGNVLQEFNRSPVRQVVSPDVATSVLAGMYAGTQGNGESRRAAMTTINVAAKTGTAQKLNPSTGLYSEDAFVASCLAIFPAEDPQVIVYMVIDYPKAGSHFGGIIAAPVIKEASEYLASYLGITKSTDTVIAHSGAVTIDEMLPADITDTVPDFTGTSKRQLLPLLSRTDISVSVIGDGWVVRQSPPAGTQVTKGMKITLELE